MLRLLSAIVVGECVMFGAIGLSLGGVAAAAETNTLAAAGDRPSAMLRLQV
jgi:hypothetical protein